MSHGLARELRWICKHDSFSVEGCVTCAAADEVERVNALRAQVEALRADAERMALYLDGYCCCPCCQSAQHCADDCTFHADCPEDAERMHGARAARWGDAARAGGGK